MPCSKKGREALGFFAARGILDDLSLERGIVDEAANFAESEPDVTSRKSQRLFTAREK
jgi:hypothetical protein